MFAIHFGIITLTSINVWLIYACYKRDKYIAALKQLVAQYTHDTADMVAEIKKMQRELN